jgi:mono/diheme cytochrome c family protein
MTLYANHLAALIVAALVATSLPALAQESGNILAGQEIASRWCNACHAVDHGTQPRATDAAPSFAAVAAMKSATAASLAAFLSTTHGQMHDYALSRDDIANVAAYILSLRKR